MSNIIDAVYLTALVCGSPYFISKFLVNKRYRAGLKQRLGWVDIKKVKKKRIWIHCASVGEILTAKEFIECLENEFNELDVVISANTNTGLSVAQRSFKDKDIFYFPLDLSWVVNRVLNIIQPDFIFLVELEIWPNFIMSAVRRRIPIALINARISGKSLKWYNMLNKISNNFLESLTKKENVFCARTKTDANRLIKLGIPETQIFTTGNMKFDNIVTGVPEYTMKQLQSLLEISDEDKILVCGSTHEGEEVILLRIYSQLLTKFNRLRLVLVPRRIERIESIIKLIESQGFSCIRKTSLDNGNKIGNQKYKTVVLVDTMGELLNIYSIADCVFVGKSLVPYGGQNIMEPAGLARPIIVGPHTFNFAEEVQLLKEANAIRIVHDESSLLKEIVFLLEHPEEAKEMGERAQAVVLKQRGASIRNLEILKEFLFKERIV